MEYEVKVYCGEEIRRLSLPLAQVSSFNGLREALSNLFPRFAQKKEEVLEQAEPSPFVIKYKDEEGDQVVLDSDTEIAKILTRRLPLVEKLLAEQQQTPLDLASDRVPGGPVLLHLFLAPVLSQEGSSASSSEMAPAEEKRKKRKEKQTGEKRKRLTPEERQQRKEERWKLKQERMEKRQRRKEERKQTASGRKVKGHHEREYQRQQANLISIDVDLGVEAWPTDSAHLFLDGNNMMFLTSALRKMSLGSQRGGAEQSILRMATSFTEVISSMVTSLQTVVVFDQVSTQTERDGLVDSNSTQWEELAVQPWEGKKVVCVGARPKWRSSDDWLVEFAEKNPSVAQNAIFVTSDRELGVRLTALGGRILKPKLWTNLAEKLIAGEHPAKQLREVSTPPPPLVLGNLVAQKKQRKSLIPKLLLQGALSFESYNGNNTQEVLASLSK
ncbi:putative Trichohyalin [Balamuthia mandrillaris]